MRYDERMGNHFQVYVLTCTPTGKRYVGATSVGFESRWINHVRRSRRSDCKELFPRALHKHGPESFCLDLLENLPDKDSMFERERELIKTLGTVSPNGLNMTGGGEGIIEPADEVLQKKSISAKEKHSDSDFKEKHRMGIVRSWQGEDGERRKILISQAHKGKKMHPNADKAIREAKAKPEYRRQAARLASEMWEKPGFREKWLNAKKKGHLAKCDRLPVSDTDGAIFSSTRAAADWLKDQGYSKAAPNNICLACNGKYKTSYGREWRWIYRGEEGFPDSMEGVRR